MKKYFLVFYLTIKEYFSYRLNFLIWRVRVFLGFLTTFFLWETVFSNQSYFLAYQKQIFITYLFLSNLVSNFVLGTRTVDIAGEIINGSIMNYLTKPFSYFSYYLWKDLADKLINLLFTIFDVSILIIFFKPPLVLNFNFQNLFLFFVFLIIGTMISFYLSLLISFIGFWSHEVWGPRFIFLILVFLLSGSFFPLDILPKNLYQLLLFTPFPYLFYLPVKLLLGDLKIINQTTIFFSFFWFFLLRFFAYFSFKKGNQSYHFFGR